MEIIKCYTCIHNLGNMDSDHADYCEELRVVFDADKKKMEEEMRKYQRFCGDSYKTTIQKAACRILSD